MELNLSTVIWSIINFVVILWVLYKFFYNPVLKFLDDRSEEIANNISEAECSRNESTALLKDYQGKIAGAREEAQNIVAKATKAGEEERAAILAQTRDESAALLERARQEIRRERDQALYALRQEVGTLSMMAAEKILTRNINTEDNQKIVEDFLNEVGDVH